jgi:predicted phosphatase
MRLLVLDLDGTLGDHEDASRLVPSFEFHTDYLVDAYGEELHLFQAFGNSSTGPANAFSSQ